MKPWHTFHTLTETQPQHTMKPTSSQTQRNRLTAALAILFATGTLIVDAAYQQCVISIGVKIYSYCGDNPPSCLMVKYRDVDGNPSYINSCMQGSPLQQCNYAEPEAGQIWSYSADCVSEGCAAASYPDDPSTKRPMNLTRRSGNPCFE